VVVFCRRYANLLGCCRVARMTIAVASMPGRHCCLACPSTDWSHYAAFCPAEAAPLLPTLLASRGSNWSHNKPESDLYKLGSQGM
jgi:hypothetical protein